MRQTVFYPPFDDGLRPRLNKHMLDAHRKSDNIRLYVVWNYTSVE